MQSIDVSTAFERINALTQEQRDAAYTNARKRIAGQKPTRAEEPKYDATGSGFTKYPADLLRFLRKLFYPVLIAAFTASAIRIFLAFFEETARSIPSYEVDIVISLMAVLLAETGQIAFTLWASIVESRLLRFALYIAALGCTAFALIANAAVVKPFERMNATDVLPFLLSMLDAFLPPVLVLIAANVRKSEILTQIADRHRAYQDWSVAHRKWEQDYKQAVQSWGDAMDDAEKHPMWQRTLVNGLRDAIRNANRKSTVTLRELQPADWYALVMRERKAEEWWDEAVQAWETLQERKSQAQQRIAITQAQPIHHGTSAGSTYEVVNAKSERSGDLYVKICPVCEQRFEGNEPRQATNRLAAHMKRHANERKVLVSANGRGGSSSPV